MISPEEVDKLIQTYKDGLLTDCLPFWEQHAVDKEEGGFLFCLDRDGTVISTDKSIWIHGRFVWLLSTLYKTVEPKKEWLELAKHGLDFIQKHAFDRDGRMFYSTDRKGNPLRKRRYLFTEAFGVIALAAYAAATKDEAIATQAADLFKLILRHYKGDEASDPKFIPETRQMKGLAMPMIILSIAQVLREVSEEAFIQKSIDEAILEVTLDFLNPDYEAVLETVGPKGEFLDNLEGRLICPGHSIELAWFILHEAKYRGNHPLLQEVGLKILDWSWKWGWDEKYGGIIYYRDAKGHSPTEYWHDMKFWWPQNEAIIATLLAWHLSGDEKYLRWHKMAHEWAYAHFPDKEHGEWYGYLHRDGRISTPVKGNMWKGPFHLPRMQWYCWQLLEEIKEAP